MTTSLNSFTSETQLGVSASTLVNTNSSETKFIGNLTLTNTSTSNVEVTLWRINSATTETTGSGGNWIFKETVPAGKTVKVNKLVGHVLGNSQKISGLAATAAVINVDISGTTET
jgi:hypothetical protein